MNIWGDKMDQFNSFGDAFMSVVFMQMGNLNTNNLSSGLIDFDSLRSYSIIWSFIFMIVYCVFMVYILLSSFMIVFIDQYRRIIIQEGTLNSSVRAKRREEIEISSFPTFLRWFLGWLPDEWLKKIAKNEDAYEDEAENHNLKGEEEQHNNFEPGVS